MRKLSLRPFASLVLGAGFVLAAGAAKAAPIPLPPGGFTLVELTAFDALAPLTPAVIAPGEGPQTLFGAIFVRFPVTAFDDVAGLIEHSGGLSLGSGPVVSLENFVVDTVAAKLFAEVNGSGASDFPLFDLVPCSALGLCPVGTASSILTGIGLNLTPEGSDAIFQTFDVLIPAGTPVGIVKQLTIVPEPTTALLLASGLSGLAWAGARRRVA